MHCKAAVFLTFIFFSGAAAGQGIVDREFYKGYFSDPSIIVLHNPKPIKAGDLIKFFSDQDHRIHSLADCTKDPVGNDRFSRRFNHGVKVTSEGVDWQVSVTIEDDALAIGGTHRSAITRKDTVEHSNPDQRPGRFRAYSESLSVDPANLRQLINVYLCPRYLNWADAIDGLVVPETVFWFEGELRVSSIVELKLEKRVSLSAAKLAPLVRQMPWTVALMNTIGTGDRLADKVSKETRMIAKFPILRRNETPTAVALRPLFVNPEIAEQISDLYETVSVEFGGAFTPEDAQAILQDAETLDLKSENSLINQVFSPSEVVFRDWIADENAAAEQNQAIARNVKRVIYLNYLATRAD